MPIARRALAPLFAGLLALFAAAPAAWGDEARLLALYRLGGLDSAFEALARNLSTEPDGSDKPEAYLRAVRRHFDPEALLAEVTAGAEGRLAPEYYDALEGWYRSVPGRRFTAAEVASQDLPPYQKEAEAEDLLAGLGERREARLALIERMNEAMLGVDTAVAISLNIAYAMTRAAQAAPDAPQGLKDADVLALARSMEPMMRAEARRLFVLDAVHAYRTFSDPELEVYVSFLETKPARALHAATLDAADAALTARSRAFAEELIRVGAMRDI